MTRAPNSPPVTPSARSSCWSRGKTEVVIGLEGIRLAQILGQWFGLAPDDSPMVLQDATRHEVYALDVDFP